jgi:hypothetical protein
MAAAINREMLEGYLDDALGEQETAEVEQALRGDDKLRRMLAAVIQDRDRGEHSLGAVWRRQRLSCPSREQLGSYLLQALDEVEQDYLDFHLKIVACSFCLANLADLKTLHVDAKPDVQRRQRRFLESSVGYLSVRRP